jgi:MFS family permease
MPQSAPLVAGTAMIVGTVLPGFLPAALQPSIAEEFRFGGAELGVAVATFYAASALGSARAGRLVDRVGVERGLLLAALTTVVGCTAVVTLAHSALALTACIAVASLGNAIGGPAVTALLRRSVVGTRQGVALGLQQAGAPLGALAAGVALPAVAIPFGWRWGYLAAALVTVAAAVVGARLPALAGSPRAVPAAAPASRTGEVRLLGVAAALASAAAVSLVACLVLYAVHEGISEAAAGLTLAAVSLGAAVSRVGLGVLIDRGVGGEPLALSARMLAVSSAAYLILAIGSPLAIVAGAVLAGIVGWAWPGVFTLAVVERAPRAPAWAVGVMMAGLFAGAVAGPLVVGLLADAERFGVAWGLCAALALAAGLVTRHAARWAPAP